MSDCRHKVKHDYHYLADDDEPVRWYHWLILIACFIAVGIVETPF